MILVKVQNGRIIKTNGGGLPYKQFNPNVITPKKTGFIKKVANAPV